MIHIGSMIALGALSLTAEATQVPQVVTTDAMVREATLTVHGTVESVVASRAPDGRIISRVSVAVERSVPKLTVASVGFDITGGTVDGIRMEVAGQSIPKEGQEVLVLLRDGRVVGAGQGVFVSSGASWEPIDGDATPLGDLSSADALLGSPSAAASCAALAATVGREEGWTPRSKVATTLRRNSARAIALGLVEGVTYRVTVCDGGEVEQIESELFDPYDAVVEQVPRDDSGRWTFTAEHTGQHLIGIQALGFSRENHRTSVTVVLEYR